MRFEALNDGSKMIDIVGAIIGLIVSSPLFYALIFFICSETLKVRFCSSKFVLANIEKDFTYTNSAP